MSVKTTNRAQEVPATTPLGARHDGRGATFALFSSVADGVELCLFDDSGAETRWSLDHGRWVCVAGLSSGRCTPAVYGHAADDPNRAYGSDSARYVPRSVLVAGDFDWRDDHPLAG